MSIEVQQAEFERSYIIAKKFGKFLLFTAAVSGAAAGAYYYLKKKNEASEATEDEFDDFDGFSDDSEEDTAKDTSSNPEDRSYVDLNLDKAKDALENAASQAVEKTEEFFDDEDNSKDAM